MLELEPQGGGKGYYHDDKEQIPLTGISKIESQRQVSILGHNYLRIDILKPPDGAGFSTEIDSHFFGKKIFIQLRLIPKPILRFSCKRNKSVREKNQ